MNRAPDPEPDLAAIRKKLDGAGGQQYWRSLEEVAQTPEFKAMLQREFPAGASEWWDGVSRRSFLKLAAASLALAGVTACTKRPPQAILPYVKQPEALVPGEPLYYATSMVLNGFATGVLAKSREGHPVKLEGNPDHPDTLGGSSVWMQASILDLYDPDRSQSVAYRGEISHWNLFLADLNERVIENLKTKGAGLRFLSGTITSPTLAGQVRELLQKFPEAKWHQFEPINRDNVQEGAGLAFGQIAEPDYHFDKAAVIVSLDSDFLYTQPARLRYARHFANGRRISAGATTMNRLYVAESTPTVTGSMAEERLPIESGPIEALARELARVVGLQAIGGADTNSLSGDEKQWVTRAAADLKKHRGASIVIAGEGQPPAVHALAYILNDSLENQGSTVVYREPAAAHPVNQLASLRELSEDMAAGKVDTLFILGCNPVYEVPADLEFEQKLQKVKHSIHSGLHVAHSGNSLPGIMERCAVFRRNRFTDPAADCAALQGQVCA